MSTDEEVRETTEITDETNPGAGEESGGQVEAEGAAEPEKRRVEMQVAITDVGPCKKHIAIEVPHSEVEHQFELTLKDLRKEATVPGFRPGRAPKALVQKRFRKEVTGQVKSALLVACMERLDDEYDLNPISQPTFDLEAIEIPENGPMSFEIDVEVQPDFELPTYKGLALTRPVKEVTPADVDGQVKQLLERDAQLVPKSGEGAEIGDYVTADLTFMKDGIVVNQAKELQFRLQPELRFQDGHVPELAKALVGAKAGETREADARIGTSSPDPALRGQTINVVFHIHDLKQLRLPELDEVFLETLGFESVDQLRTALEGVLERRYGFEQRQALRRQILDELIAKVPIELPKDLVERQERTTLRRLVEELRQSGLSDTQIRGREAELRANAHERTLRSLKEHFLLNRIADAEEVKVEEDDIEAEILSIAMRTGESPRRVRARLEREGLIEGLSLQLLEQKTLNLILQHAEIKEVPLVEAREVETIAEGAAQESLEGEQEGESSDSPAAVETSSGDE